MAFAAGLRLPGTVTPVTLTSGITLGGPHATSLPQFSDLENEDDGCEALNWASRNGTKERELEPPNSRLLLG